MSVGEGRPRVDPTAWIAGGATVAASAWVGPCARVHEGAVIEEGVRIGPRVCVGPHVVVRQGSFVDTGACLGIDGPGYTDPDKPPVIVGRGSRVREYAVVRGSASAPSRIGDGAFVMSRVLIGAGVDIGAGAVVTHGSVLLDGARVAPGAVLGGFCVVEPGVSVGARAMVGALSRISGPVPPFCLAHGVPATLRGLNLVGLRRAGVAPDARQALDRAFRILLRSGRPLPQAGESLREEAETYTEVAEFLRFVLEHPEARRLAEGADPGGVQRVGE